MRKTFATVMVSGIVAVGAFAFAARDDGGGGRADLRPPVATEGNVSVWFSPDGGCAGAVVAAVDSARRSIDLAAYSFTNAQIAKAVVNAHKRGVRVRAVLDESQAGQQYTSATFLFNAGVPVRIWDGEGLMHNKFIVVDNTMVVTGSFNFTKQAEEKNAENLVMFRDRPKIAKAYAQAFERLLRESKAYERHVNAPRRRE